MTLDFNGGGLNITSEASRKINFSATSSVICDKNGHLLFSSNGIFISNASNDTMTNGSGLNPSYYTSINTHNGLGIPQANLIIPFPGDSSKYYLFHETDDDYANTDASFYFYYSIVDMSEDNGNGAVLQKNVILTSDAFVGGFVTACKHANGRDWWLINHQCFTNKYFKYLITPLGIEGPYEQSIGSIRNGDYFGQVVFSSDGKKMAYYDPNYDLDILDFDRCAGDLSNLIHIDINDSAALGGISFSSDSKLLYVSSNKYVYQFDLSSSNVSSTKTTVAVYDGFAELNLFSTDFGPTGLAPDGKIYIIPGNGTHFIHVINNPNIVGTGCDVCQHCIQLPAYNYLTVPNHPNYFLGAETGSICDSLTGLTPVLSKGEGVLNIYPNPSITEDLTFTYGVSSEQGVLSVYNIEGKEVVQYSIPQWSSVQHLKLPKMAAGIYMARLRQGQIISSVKFIKE